MDGSISAAIMEHLRAAQEQGIDLAAAESSRAKASSDMAIVKAAISEMGEQIHRQTFCNPSLTAQHRLLLGLHFSLLKVNRL